MKGTTVPERRLFCNTTRTVQQVYLLLASSSLRVRITMYKKVRGACQTGEGLEGSKNAGQEGDGYNK